jgi:hypothetical protein
LSTNENNARPNGRAFLLGWEKEKEEEGKKEKEERQTRKPPLAAR